MPNTTYFIEVMLNYDFGDEPHSASFEVTTSSYSEPRNLIAPNDNVTINTIFLSWEQPEVILGDPKDLRYKITSSKIGFNDGIGESKENNDEDVWTVIEDETSTFLYGLESYTEYLITIEAIYSPLNTTFYPPLPKIITINGRSMIKVYTKPDYPKNLSVTLLPENRANVSWNHLAGGHDVAKHVYTLSWDRMEKNGSCEHLNETKRLSEKCKFTVYNHSQYATSENKHTIPNLVPEQFLQNSNYYRFKVMVKTPHGLSSYSPAVIKFVGNLSDLEDENREEATFDEIIGK